MRKNQITKWGSELAGEFLVVLLVPLIVPFLLLRLGFGILLHMMVWVFWCPRGKYILFVYSDSPIWKDYIEKNILPRLQTCAVILNWSQRKSWPRWFSLPVMLFNFFGGRRKFNPIGIVFHPLKLRKVFRFWEPFQEYKHGNSQPLAEIQSQFLGFVEAVKQRRLSPSS